MMSGIVIDTGLDEARNIFPNKPPHSQIQRGIGALVHMLHITAIQPIPHFPETKAETLLKRENVPFKCSRLRYY